MTEKLNNYYDIHFVCPKCGGKELLKIRVDSADVDTATNVAGRLFHVPNVDCEWGYDQRYMCKACYQEFLKGIEYLTLQWLEDNGMLSLREGTEA